MRRIIHGGFGKSEVVDVIFCKRESRNFKEPRPAYPFYPFAYSFARFRSFFICIKDGLYGVNDSRPSRRVVRNKRNGQFRERRLCPCIGNLAADPYRQPVVFGISNRHCGTDGITASAKHACFLVYFHARLAVHGIRPDRISRTSGNSAGYFAKVSKSFGVYSRRFSVSSDDCDIRR